MRNASGTKQTALHTARLICCEVNATEYCLEMSAVRSIGRLHQLGFRTDLAGVETPKGAIGWVVAQQNKYPVYDLAAQLDLADTNITSAAPEGFVMLINAAQPFALRVDRIVGNLEIELTQVAALPHIIEPTSDKLFKGIVRREDKWTLYAEASRLRRTQPAPILSLPRSSSHSYSANNVTTSQLEKTKSQIMLFSSAQRTGNNNEAQPMVFGLSLKQVQEISPLLPIIPVPHAPDYVFGLTNWRDVPLPIIDLQARLGISQQPAEAHLIDPKSRLLIARAASGLIGVPIHPQVKAFKLPIPYQQAQHFLSLDQTLALGVFDLEGSPLIIPDLDAILTRNFAPLS